MARPSNPHAFQLDAVSTVDIDTVPTKRGRTGGADPKNKLWRQQNGDRRLQTVPVTSNLVSGGQLRPILRQKRAVPRSGCEAKPSRGNHGAVVAFRGAALAETGARNHLQAPTPVQLVPPALGTCQTRVTAPSAQHAVAPSLHRASGITSAMESLPARKVVPVTAVLSGVGEQIGSSGGWHQVIHQHGGDSQAAQLHVTGSSSTSGASGSAVHGFGRHNSSSQQAHSHSHGLGFSSSSPLLAATAMSGATAAMSAAAAAAMSGATAPANGPPPRSNFPSSPAGLPLISTFVSGRAAPTPMDDPGYHHRAVSALRLTGRASSGAARSSSAIGWMMHAAEPLATQQQQQDDDDDDEEDDDEYDDDDDEEAAPERLQHDFDEDDDDDIDDEDDAVEHGRDAQHFATPTATARPSSVVSAESASFPLASGMQSRDGRSATGNAAQQHAWAVSAWGASTTTPAAALPTIEEHRHTSSLELATHQQPQIVRASSLASEMYSQRPSSSSSSFARLPSPPPLVARASSSLAVAAPSVLDRPSAPAANALEPSARPAHAVPWGVGFSPAVVGLTAAQAARAGTPDAALWAMDMHHSAGAGLPSLAAGLRRMRVNKLGNP